MSELTPTITKAVETWTAKLLNYFKERYGAIIFAPLGVNDQTPAKIAPNIAQSVEQSLLGIEWDKATLYVIDDRVGVVFDTFMDNFFDSLNFLAKTAMKAMGMKMSWNDFVSQLADKKINNPESYNNWKNNWVMVLHTLFDEVVGTLQASWKEVLITNGEKYFSTSEESILSMKIFS